MENLFDVINNKMFSVFERKDRRTNYDLLATIYDIFVRDERQQAISKEDLIDKETAYIKGRPFDEFDDEDNLSLAEKSAKDKATYKLRQFKKCGWIEEDNANGFEIVVSLSDAAISLLDTFKKIIVNNDEPLEYTGYFYIIYNTLKEFDHDKAKALIEQIVKNTNELFNSLQSLHSRIKSFTKQLLNRKELSPQEVLNILLYKYQDQVILTVFNNLKGKDNPSKYTSDILLWLKRLREDDIDKLVRSYAKTVNVRELTSEKFIEIEEKLVGDLDEVIARFESVDSFINLIDYKNSKFHTSAIATINFLMNNRRDISGQIDMALRTMSQVDIDEDFGDLFEIFYTENIDDQSLHSRKFNKDKKTEIPSQIPHVSQEELEAEMALIFSKDEYSRESINEYVLELLGDYSRISTIDLVVKDMEGFFKLIVLQIFSEYDDMCYSLEYHNQKQSLFGYTMESFDIIRRVK